MPILSVQLIAGRPPELKERLIAELTQTAVDVLDVPAQSVRVILTEVPAEHWGVAGVSRAAQQNPDNH
jgi:4-oxalocrotonate tautomerase